VLTGLFQVENLSNLGCDVVCMVVNREKDVMCKTCTVVGDQWLDKTESIQKFRDFVGRIFSLIFMRLLSYNAEVVCLSVPFGLLEKW